LNRRKCQATKLTLKYIQDLKLNDIDIFGFCEHHTSDEEEYKIVISLLYRKEFKMLTVTVK
jgi:hypothetical protein